jgi:ABC-type phosphate transport system substrate-binding protein
MPFRAKGVGARRIAIALVLGLSPLSYPAADIVVIGNSQIGISSLSEQAVTDLYLGRLAQLGSGQRVEVVDLPPGHPARDEFYTQVLGRDPTQIRAYWAKRIFTGKGTPPATRPDEKAVIKWVSEAPGRIGYVRSEALDDADVKVLLRKDGKKSQ